MNDAMIAADGQGEERKEAHDFVEMAAHCRQVSLLTVDGARYFCAPIARVETATPAAVPDSPSAATQL